jgi:hypothetical protein
MKRCHHRTLIVRTEEDRCSWVECAQCKKTGPSKHSYTLALIAWTLHAVNQHPRVTAVKRARG